MDRLRAEIAAACAVGCHPSRDDLKRMPYLQIVLKESTSPGSNLKLATISQDCTALRLYPPVPVNTRTALKTTVLPVGGGPAGEDLVLIPKGSTVAFSVYCMHRRSDLYGIDAELFRPERWNEEMPLKNNPTNLEWGYLPFYGGPRRCLGGECMLCMSYEALADESVDRRLCAHTSWVYYYTSAQAFPCLETP